MIPGMNPRDVQRAMRKLGMQQETIIASEVIIRCQDKDIIIQQPSVMKVNMMGEENYQISGTIKEQPRAAAITEEDITAVMQQTGKDKETARAALETHGDIAKAILSLT